MFSNSDRVPVSSNSLCRFLRSSLDSSRNAARSSGSTVAVVSAASILVLVARLRLDTEVLNLLPSNFESVEGLKVYNSDFAQTRELTFALVSQPEDADKLEEFAPRFAESLRKQPWCVRVLAGSPMETPDGIRDLQNIALPLLLNLEPTAFDETIALLQPAKIQQRLHRLREEIEAGSPRPQFELQLDPLGLVAPALKPFAANASLEEEQPLTSADRTTRIILAVTNQRTIGAFDCQKLMRQVNAFRARAHEGWDGGPLQILVTGRSAYVAEISLSMRHDIIVTLFGSMLLVGGVFYIGFRRWLPLLGMGISLLLCCLVALAIGILIFHETEHGDGRILRDPHWSWRRFCHSDFRSLPTGARRRPRSSARRRRINRQPRSRDFLRRINDGGWISRVALERLCRIHATRRPDRDRNFLCRFVHDNGLLSFHSAKNAAATWRLDFYRSQKITCAGACRRPAPMLINFDADPCACSP